MKTSEGDAELGQNQSDSLYVLRVRQHEHLPKVAGTLSGTGQREQVPPDRIGCNTQRKAGLAKRAGRASSGKVSDRRASRDNSPIINHVAQAPHG